MASLKELRKRIDSIKSTQKITSAMKMVAAARLRKAQQLIGKSSFYSRNLLISAQRIVQELVNQQEKSNIRFMFPKMMTGNGSEKAYLLLVLSSDRGLCGGFNVNIAKETIHRIEKLKRAGKEVKIICVGKKARDILKRKHSSYIVDSIEGLAAKGADYNEACLIAQKIMDMYDNKEFDICEVITSKFHSAINREVTIDQIYPVTIDSNLIDEEDVLSSIKDHVKFIPPAMSSVSLKQASSYLLPNDILKTEEETSEDERVQSDNVSSTSTLEEKLKWFMDLPPLTKVGDAFYKYEPDPLTMLENLLPLIFRAVIFQAIVHSQASEQGARMTSMDNATRNARDMISRLTLKYNGLRQSAITTELIEIISGAEAI